MRLLWIAIAVALGGCLTSFPEPSGSGAASGTTTGSGGGAPSCKAPALEMIAKSLAKGGSAVLPAQGLTRDLLVSSIDLEPNIAYGYKGVWDPSTCQAFFLGSNPKDSIHFVVYDGATNTWRSGPKPDWQCDYTPQTAGCALEVFGLQTGAPDLGELYVFKDRLRSLKTTTPLGALWTELPLTPFDASKSLYTSIEYFPERHSVLYLDYAENKLWELPTSAPAWKEVPIAGLSSTDPGYMSYSPRRQKVFIVSSQAGQSSFLLAADGTATPLPATPMEFGEVSGADHFKILTADPAGGAFLGITHFASAVFELDEAGQTWKQTGTLSEANAQVAIPVSTFGVVLVLTGGGTEMPKMLVYKHL